MIEKYFLSRHSIKPKGGDLESSEFSGISERGVEIAKERAQEIFSDLEKSENGTVMFLGGASELPRTKSTAMVYGKEMKNLIMEQGRDDIVILLPEDIEEIEGFTNKVNFIAEQVKTNPNKKIILDFPLFMKEFSFKGTWTDDKGNPSQYLIQLFKKNGNNEEAAMEDWFDNQGIIGDLVGPNPKEVAEQQLAGIERLREFAKKYM